MNKALVFVASLTLIGCDVGDGTRVGSGNGSVSTDNRLSFNRISFNRISFNRISFNRISFNRISFNRLSFNTLASDGLEETPEGREFIEYLAKCALENGDILVVEYDGVTYDYPGLLGLAPEWEDAPLTHAGRRRVSACLLAHVNAFEISVPISVRSPDGRIYISQLEHRNYEVFEATFYGDISPDPMQVFACTADPYVIAIAESRDREFRVCSDSVPGQDVGACQITTTGSCASVCRRTHENMWEDCEGADRVRYDETIAVYLFTGDHSSQ